jgi:hypothetical protein
MMGTDSQATWRKIGQPTHLSAPQTSMSTIVEGLMQPTLANDSERQ